MPLLNVDDHNFDLNSYVEPVTPYLFSYQPMSKQEATCFTAWDFDLSSVWQA